ncbi:OmpA family protein [Aestuariivita sp.]|jgi:outer membrane protein OmpA-like peptidoglycan-associated protein|uniref:OmpA family protein n=1 Tax=Aestuariivita sp. TaxID=1872407 RepID=UPI00217354D5|nr:OmpA family protein [Aestuariivita sp.]MCE8007330.1 OmpA family protein [Aestuariivita sp.]
MTRVKTPVLVAAAALLGLTACTDPGQLNDPNNPNRNRDQGVLLGAGVGAALGQIIGGDTEATLGGAVAGAVAGGLIGNTLDRQEADLRQSLGNDQVQITNTGDRLIVTLPQDILFATESFTVRPDLRRDLQAVAGNLQAYPDSTIQIIGHTDNTGDADFNQRLSERRANAVADVLLDAGVPFSRIRTVGRGESQPVASNLNPQGRAQNRRVEIVILPNA